MALAAGTLNSRVIIQTVSLEDDGGGGSTETWTDTATVWAHIEELSGAERFQAQQVAASLSHRVTMRYRALTPQQRIKFGTRVLKINAVTNPDQRNEMLAVWCEEVNI